MSEIKYEYGIEKLRAAAQMFAHCNEDFNMKWTVPQLMNIWNCVLKCDWDFYPDSWSHRQQYEAAHFNIVPDFELKDGKYVALYKREGGKEFTVECSWTETATVRVHAKDKIAARAFADGDMPTPDEGVYLDDSFNVDAVREVKK